jgi:hypothetical protein
MWGQSEGVSGIVLLTRTTICLQVKQGLMFWGKPDAPPIDLPPFIRNKIAQAIVSILQVSRLVLPSLNKCLPYIKMSLLYSTRVEVHFSWNLMLDPAASLIPDT